MILNILYKAIVVASVEIDEKTVLTKKLMNEDRVISEFTTKEILPLRIGCYIVVEGLNYTIRKLPTIVKVNDNTFNYTVLFESELDTIKDKLLISSDGLTEFSYVGTAEELLTMLIASINEIKIGWQVGTVDVTDSKKIDFANENCYTALYKIANEFKFEFIVANKTIHLQAAVGTLKSVTFEYGKTKGLYSIERRLIANSELYTRVYGFGSEKNIPYTYRDNAKRLIFEEEFLEKEVGAYGVKEGYYINEDIYPQRTGTLTDTSIQFIAEAYNVTESYITDATIDFNINDYLIEGLTAKIVFKSGDLSGYQFEIWKFDSANKRIYINPYSEANGFNLPNENSLPKIGDSYTLIDIEMPPSYVIAAEAELKAATQVFLDENSIPKTMYVVKMDQKFIKTLTEVISIGDLVGIKDNQMGIDRAIRIAQLSYPLVNPNKKEAIIADEIPYIQRQLTAKQAAASAKAIAAVYTKIVQEINNKTIINNEVTNETTIVNEPNTVLINGKKFRYVKGYDNTTNLEVLETGDFIIDNYWDRYTYVKKWLFLGGIKEKSDNWDRIETIDLTPAI